jgi:ABC-2 type transport system ATP-binding protein
MKQRLAIASALLNDPEILILDEPTNGLDPEGIHQIREIIKNIAKNGTTILLASHLLDEVEKVCSHVVILKKGKSIYTGRVDGITANNGFFILQSDDLQKLQAALEKIPEIKNTKISGDFVMGYLNTKLDGKQLNKLLFEQGIILSYLVFRKESLEEQFLEITKNLK